MCKNKNFLITKILGLNVFNSEFFKTLKKKISSLYKLFQKTKKNGITQIPKPNKTFTRMKNYRPLFLMNLGIKNLNKCINK